LVLVFDRGARIYSAMCCFDSALGVDVGAAPLFLPLKPCPTIWCLCRIRQYAEHRCLKMYGRKWKNNNRFR